MLGKTGFDDVEISETDKHTFVAAFVNAEAAKYLIIEDDFPNGRPPLEKAGVYLTDRETVRKMDQMKVCACLNPLHTILAVSGMLLGYPTISACMKDKNLVKLLRKAASEALPVVPHPGIIDPKDFLNEVLTERFPNPFIPDAPARIASDTSQKVPIRFGITLKERKEQGLPLAELEAIPLFVALFLRYRMGIDDKGAKMELSPDPRLPVAFNLLYGVALGDAAKIDLRPMLSDAATFGVDLYAVGLGAKIEALFADISAGTGAVAAKLGE
jgi:fructuronate reductase